MKLMQLIFHSISNIGFFTAWLAIGIGIIISFITAGAGNKFKGTLLGFLGGLLLSVVCFDLIPDAFVNGSILIGISAMLFGLAFSTFLDGYLQTKITKTSQDKKQRLYKAAIFLTIGVAIDNFPAGIALGSLFSVSLVKGLQLALILVIHGIPEGLSIGYFLKESRKSLFTVLLFSIIASIPMGFGAMLGAMLSKVSTKVISISLAFASGLIMYVVFRETLGEARETWKGRLSTIGNVLGMIFGFLAVSLIH